MWDGYKKFHGETSRRIDIKQVYVVFFKLPDECVCVRVSV